MAFALQTDDWYLRQDIIWHKANPIPESVRDRCTKAHEYIFLLSKSVKYFYDSEAIKETDSGTDHPRRILSGQPSLEPTNNLMPKHSGLRKADGRIGQGRNKRSVWTISTQPFPEAHFATFPPRLIEPCILAGSPERGVVLDPFFGAGTTGYMCEVLNRKWIGIELNKKYCELAARRIERETRQMRLFN